MQDLPSGLPPDAAAYLLEAAEEIAKEQNIKPSSPDELKVWLEANTEAIAKRAIALQHDLLNKLESPEGKKIKDLMSITVWTEIRRRELVSAHIKRSRKFSAHIKRSRKFSAHIKRSPSQRPDGDKRKPHRSNSQSGAFALTKLKDQSNGKHKDSDECRIDGSSEGLRRLLRQGMAQRTK